MKRRKLYLYNPETDNFERFYPSIKDRLTNIGIILLTSLILGGGLALLIIFSDKNPTAEETIENLRMQNKELKQQYAALDRNLSASFKILNEIQERDSNFYRVLLQMDPLNHRDLNQVVISSSKPIKMRDIGDAQLVGRLYQRIDTLNRNLLHQSVSFNMMREVAINNQEKLDHIPAILPINIKDYTMSSGYGTRIDPVYDTHKFHAGLDFAAAMGTQVFATADGVVDFAGQKGGYGNCIDIGHGNNYMTRYAHLEKILVSPGKKVKRGELIGLVGSTGKSTGPHLHYEVRFKDEPQNPVNYYFLDLTPEEYDEMIEMAENAGHIMD